MAAALLLLACGAAAAEGGVNLFEELLAHPTAQWAELRLRGNETGAGQLINTAACVLGDAMYVHGGATRDESAVTGEFWRFDFATLEWARVDVRGPVKPSNRTDHYMVCDEARQRIYLFLGQYELGDIEVELDDAYVFNVMASTWHALPSAATGDANAVSWGNTGNDGFCANTVDLIVCAGNAVSYAIFDKVTETWRGREEATASASEDASGFGAGYKVFFIGGETKSGWFPNQTYVLDTEPKESSDSEDDEGMEWILSPHPGMAGDEQPVAYTPGSRYAVMVGDSTDKVYTLDVEDYTWERVRVHPEEWAIRQIPSLENARVVGYRGALITIGAVVEENSGMWAYHPSWCPGDGCSGYGTCQRGNCVCEPGRFGVACEGAEVRTIDVLPIILPTAVVLVVLVVLVEAHRRWQMKQRAAALAFRTRYAPRAGSGNGKSCMAAIVFTDIYQSTKVWAEVPEAMKEALATHHRIARDLISIHHGYEVKTIGDAFMVAFTCPLQATKFALDFQDRLYRALWPDALLAHDACKAEDCQRGLRVRMGVNYGDVNVVDMDHGGYDYEGHVVNLASRVSDSGCPGQVLLTSDAYNEIIAQVDHTVDLTYLGKFQFSGMPEETGVFQALPDSLAERRFGELRKAEKISVRKESASNTVLALHAAHRAIRSYCKSFGPNGVPVGRLTELLVCFAAESGPRGPPLLTAFVRTLAKMGSGPTAPRGPRGGATVVVIDSDSEDEGLGRSGGPTQGYINWRTMYLFLLELPPTTALDFADALPETSGSSYNALGSTGAPSIGAPSSLCLLTGVPSLGSLPGSTPTIPLQPEQNPLRPPVKEKESKSQQAW